MRLQLLGTTVHVAAPEPLSSALAALLPRGEATPSVEITASRASGGAWSVDGPQGPLRATDDAHALELLLSQLNHAFLAGPPGFAAHAGVVSRAGVALALPGASGAGKSTLVAACLRAGFDYVSDEALIATWGGGEVVPYAKPLTLLGWSLARLGLDGPAAGRSERSMPPTELGAVTAAGPLQLGHVVLPRRALPRRATGGPVLAPLPRAEAAAELLRQSFNHYTDPAGSVAVVSRLVRGAQTWTLAYDDPVEAAELLRTL